MRTAVTLLAVLLALQSATADVVSYEDYDDWVEGVGGSFTTIGFNDGYPDGTFITDQYADLGVNFVDGNDNIFLVPPPTFHDGAGIDGNLFITLDFTAPITSIGFDHPGFHLVQLFHGGELIFTSDVSGGGGVGFFSGWVSTEPFDMIVLDNPFSVNVAIDDLHFGPPIPAPSALGLIALGLMRPSRRRG